MVEMERKERRGRVRGVAREKKEGKKRISTLCLGWNLLYLFNAIINGHLKH